jgi:sulfoxide reductase heme-binding subunit YedZ
MHALTVLVLLAPAVWLALRGVTSSLGVNPIEKTTHETGIWALRWLLLGLAVTPVRRLTGWNQVIRLRRTIGLFAFGYAAVHLATYVVLDQFFDWPSIAADLTRRPYIVAGAVAVVSLTPLAVTSTAGWIRRLGGRNWQRLHRLAYVAAIAAVVHYWWLVKADVSSPRRYAIALAVLLGVRVWWSWSKTARDGRPRH